MKVDDGGRPIYRSACELKLERAVEKKLKKSKWWGEAYDTILFVQATPDGE